MIDRQGAALADTITTGARPAAEDRARQRLPDHHRRSRLRTLDGQSQAKIAAELYPIVENILDELDRWLSTSR